MYIPCKGILESLGPAGTLRAKPGWPNIEALRIKRWLWGMKEP